MRADGEVVAASGCGGRRRHPRGAAGCASNDSPPKAKPSPTPTARTEVTFAVYGPKPVIDAYKQIAADFTVEHPTG